MSIARHVVMAGATHEGDADAAGTPDPALQAGQAPSLQRRGIVATHRTAEKPWAESMRLTGMNLR